MEYKDYYKALGVSKQATAQEIKSAFRKLARKNHPDLHPGDKAAEERFKVINEAHEVLSDPGKRKKYDELGANWEEIQRNRDYARQYAAPGHDRSDGGDTIDLSDFFETFFGGRGGGRRGGSREWGPFAGGRRGPAAKARGDDLASPVEITLEEAFHGTTRRLQLQTEQPCLRCGGTGMVAGHARRAGGRGEQAVGMSPCPECGGQGVKKVQRSLDVKIPHGVTEGSRVRLAGMGNPGVNGGPPGDLYLETHTRPHRLFQVKEHDLVCDLPVRDDEAALGATVEAPTLDGRVTVKIPPGSQPGSRLRLKGKGLPKLHGAGHGDLYYVVNIVIPILSEEEQRLVQQLRRVREQQGEAANPRRALLS